MKVGTFINTPAQKYFWENIAKKLSEKGHEIVFLVREYREISKISDGDKVFVYSYKANSKYGKYFSLPFDVIRATKYLKKENVKMVSGFGVYDVVSAHILRIFSLNFTDTDPKSNPLYSLQLKFYPLADAVVTPECFKIDFGKRHIKIPSYKELAYLNPIVFNPKDDIFDYLDISKGEKYVVLRFTANDAIHDMGFKPLSWEDRFRLVRELEKFSHVFISSEKNIPKELDSYSLKTPKNRIHDVLYYADLVVADTATIPTEAAILGTPSIRYTSFSKDKDWSYPRDLEDRFGLMFNVSNIESLLKASVQILENENSKKIWREKREKLFEKTIDIASFMAWFIEMFPDSLEEFKNEPDNVKRRFRWRL
ncbi:MAG: DUF354 domain-containing protein [Archaeoglobaceae archaeon]